MSKPNMAWVGSTDALDGVVTFVSGNMKETMALNSCADAMKIQRMLEEAYHEGTRDEYASIRRQLLTMFERT